MIYKQKYIRELRVAQKRAMPSMIDHLKKIRCALSELEKHTAKLYAELTENNGVDKLMDGDYILDAQVTRSFDEIKRHGSLLNNALHRAWVRAVG